MVQFAKLLITGVQTVTDRNQDLTNLFKDLDGWQIQADVRCTTYHTGIPRRITNTSAGKVPKIF